MKKLLSDHKTVYLFIYYLSFGKNNKMSKINSLHDWNSNGSNKHFIFTVAHQKFNFINLIMMKKYQKLHFLHFLTAIFEMSKGPPNFMNLRMTSLLLFNLYIFNLRTGSSCLMRISLLRISLLRFFKTITKIWLMRFYGLFILLVRT